MTEANDVKRDFWNTTEKFYGADVFYNDNDNDKYINIILKDSNLLYNSENSTTLE